MVTLVVFVVPVIGDIEPAADEEAFESIHAVEDEVKEPAPEVTTVEHPSLPQEAASHDPPEPSLPSIPIEMDPPVPTADTRVGDVGGRGRSRKKSGGFFNFGSMSRPQSRSRLQSKTEDQPQEPTTSSGQGRPPRAKSLPRYITYTVLDL